MKKIIIFGNSGSGKSTLAKQYAAKFDLQHLDLDILAWQDTNPPTRLALDKSALTINKFLDDNNNWIIEGGYCDLLDRVKAQASEIIFLNPGVDTCLQNCKNRPWESHKYDSIEIQNNNLDMLLDWVKQYSTRQDEFSLQSHQQFFNNYDGVKIEFKSNNRD